MTTEITIKAMCSEEKEVTVLLTNGEEVEETTILQNGESVSEYVYDNRVITIFETEK